ncbi:hypothetical protein IAU60_003079 [Kwoniella sp. DSM 27419]
MTREATCAGCKCADVSSCLERTDPHHGPSRDFALEVVKRYARMKIARGKARELTGKNGKLEALEAKFAHLGYQDIFYLARFHLRLPPSALTLPGPSPAVRRTLMKAGYPLSPQLECSVNASMPSTRRNSLTIADEDTPVLPAFAPGAMRRSSSSRPDLPSTSPTASMSVAGTSRAGSHAWTSSTRTSKSNSCSTPTSPTFSGSPRSSHTGASRWTPLLALAGLGIKSTDQKTGPTREGSRPPSPRIAFTLDPFSQASEPLTSEPPQLQLDPISPSEATCDTTPIMIEPDFTDSLRRGSYRAAGLKLVIGSEAETEREFSLMEALQNTAIELGQPEIVQVL